jgi:hypothetical protein
LRTPDDIGKLDGESVEKRSERRERMLKRYLIERDIEGVGTLSPKELCGAAQTSNAALAELAPRVQWQHSYVANDKTFCVYLAEDEDAVRAHAEKAGVPATKITEVSQVIDPTTAKS